MCPHCLATILTFRGIPHHSRLNLRTFPGMSADNPQTVVVLSGESVNRTLFPRLTRIVRRNGVIHFGNVSWSCPCSSGRQALPEDATVLVANYGISNAIVLDIPLFATKTAIYTFFSKHVVKSPLLAVSVWYQRSSGKSWHTYRITISNIL